MKNLSMFLMACLAARASAQTGSYTWQVSANNSNWSSSVIASPGSLAHVRLLASWSGLAGTDQAYCGGQFDATVVGGSSSTPITNILRPTPFAFAAQTLVSSQYSQGLKIDTTTDFAEPGVGAGWVNPGQTARDFAFPYPFNTFNPCVMFQYDIIASDQVLTIGMEMNPTPRRAMSIYINSGGTQKRLSHDLVSVSNAFIVPAPASSVFLIAAAAAVTRRRSNRERVS